MIFDKLLSLFVGIFFILFGIYLSLIRKYPHFYTFFSLGFLIISLLIYSHLYGKTIFKEWSYKKIVLLFIFVLVASIIIDKIGVFLGYWTYPHYDSIFDEVIKYLFEWTVPLIAFMIIFMIGDNWILAYGLYSISYLSIC